MKQVALDSITYSEELFASSFGTNDSFLTFAEKVMSAFQPDFFATATVKTNMPSSATLVISYHGSAVGDNVARALMNVARRFYKSIHGVQRNQPGIKRPGEISDLTNSCSKAYGKSGDAAVGAAVSVLVALRLGLLYKDIV